MVRSDEPTHFFHQRPEPGLVLLHGAALGKHFVGRGQFDPAQQARIYQLVQGAVHGRPTNLQPGLLQVLAHYKRLLAVIPFVCESPEGFGIGCAMPVRAGEQGTGASQLLDKGHQRLLGGTVLVLGEPAGHESEHRLG